MSASNTPNASQFSFQSTSENSSTSRHLIYFITGNPGLISYYNTFLKTLNDLLSLNPTSNSDFFHIHGQSLACFEDASTPPGHHTPFTLEEQISFSLTALQELHNTKNYGSVILIGHSVGAYILLELITRLRRFSQSSPIKIKAGILLFPTVTHIALSPSGVKMSTLFRLPDFPRRAAFVAKNLVTLVPRSVLRWLVGVVTRMPSEAAEVTTNFLRSRMGIWQAL